MHSLLVLRANKLIGCTEGSEEEAELALTTDTVERYEATRWPDGKVGIVKNAEFAIDHSLRS